MSRCYFLVWLFKKFTENMNLPDRQICQEKKIFMEKFFCQLINAKKY